MVHIPQSNIRRTIVLSGLFVVFVTAILCLTGCDTVSYYSQGIQGHFDLVSRVKPIEDVIEHSKTPEKTRKQLTNALKVRQFAINTLKLPDNNSYKGYADLKRKNVTWNVVATKELSMEPYKSCFPVTGCLSYRGYFSEDNAKQFADKLKQEGYEIHIGGSSAYSTLGWFKDPIVSPMLRYGDIQLAQTLFHELAHQRLYIKDDSDFNEAFATAVGQNGVREWLTQTDPKAVPRFNKNLSRYSQFLKLLSDTASELKELYSTQLSDEGKREKKKQLIAVLRTNYQGFKKQHPDYTNFDGWFEKPINNPRLAMVSVYHELVPDFDRWLQACGNDFPRFYSAIEGISKMPKEQRISMLKKSTSCH